MQLNEKIIIGYLSGPVDARKVYKMWQSDQPNNYLGTSYLTEFFEVVKQMDFSGIVVTSEGRASYQKTVANISIINAPKPRGGNGLSYHLNHSIWTYRAIKRLVSEGSNIILLTDSQNYWFCTIFFRFKGVRFVNALHAAIWPEFRTLTLSESILRLTNSVFHYIWGDPSLSASHRIDEQLSKTSFGQVSERLVFMPSYNKSEFSFFENNRKFIQESTFRILYAGRITKDKGIFDVIDVAKILSKEDIRFVFDVCGDGIDLLKAREYSLELAVDNIIDFHGFCGREDMIRVLRDCHCVIVPTKAELGEGFAMIAAEGVLAGKPVVTSEVVPALKYIRPAAVEAITDSPASYAQAIRKLATNASLYEVKRKGALVCREIFLNPQNGYKIALLAILDRLIRR